MASFVLYIAWMTSSLAIASNTETNSLSCYAPRVPTELSHIEGRLGLIGSPIAQFDASSFMITPITQNSNYNPHYLFTQTPQFLKPVENEVHVDTLLNSSAPLWKGNPSIAQSASVSQLISTTVLFAHEHNNEGRDTFKWVPHCDGLDHTMQATNHATEQNHAFTTTTLPTLDYTTNNKHEHALIHVPNQATIAFPHDPVRSRFFEMIAFPGDYIDTSRSADDGGVHLSQPNACMHASSIPQSTLNTTDNTMRSARINPLNRGFAFPSLRSFSCAFMNTFEPQTLMPHALPPFQSMVSIVANDRDCHGTYSGSHPSTHQSLPIPTHEFHQRCAANDPSNKAITTSKMICPSRTKTSIDCLPTTIDPHPIERSICASTVQFSSLFFEDIHKHTQHSCIPEGEESQTNAAIGTCTRPFNNVLNTCFSPPSAIHSTAFNEATNAFNTTPSSPHGLNLPTVQSSSVSSLISTSVLVITHVHNEGRCTFANNNIPGQQTEARMTGIQSLDEEFTHTPRARIFTHPMWILAGYLILTASNSHNKQIQKYLTVFILLNFTWCSALDVSAGGFHTCALSSQFHTVKCFGWNNYGQLGLEDTNDRGDEAGEMGEDLPTIDLGSNFDVVQIAVGSHHSCALSTTGKVKCFGRNNFGQLGLGDTLDRGNKINDMGDKLPEVDLGTDFIATQIAAGCCHNCALSQSNTVKCWGFSNSGGLGLGDQNNRGDQANEMGNYLPEVDLGASFQPVAIIAGGTRTCALSSSNTMKCFGWNNYGQLGYGDTNNRGDGAGEMGDKLPEIDLGSNEQIALGYYHTCAVHNCTVKCWGLGAFGSLGYGDTINRGDTVDSMGDNLPEVDLGSNICITQIEAWESHNCVISSSNKVKCFGWNQYGQLGLGDTENRGDQANEMGDDLPDVDLGSNFNPVQIALGEHHTCAISSSNTVKCFGYNAHGQLGQGDTNNRGDGANEMGENLPEIDIGIGFATRHPTHAPSAASSAPTSAPSTAPTSAPSTAPTSAPTACMDLRSSYNETDDGTDEWHVDSWTAIDFMYKVASPSMINNASGIAQYVTKPVHLNASSNHLVCLGLVSCLQSQITGTGDSDTFFNIECIGELSCNEAIVDISGVHNVHILCDGDDACASTTMDVRDVNSTVVIDCVASHSCTGADIYLSKNNQNTITCYLLNACDDISIQTTDHEDTKLKLYSYSQNVQLDNGYGLTSTKDNLQCILPNRYVRYNASISNDPSEVMTRVANEYIGNTFACDDVKIICDHNQTNETIDACDVSYDVKHVSLPTANPASQCYWVSLLDVVTVNCIGNCFLSPTEWPTNAPSAAPTSTTLGPTNAPSSPTHEPTNGPTSAPTASPTNTTIDPTHDPTNDPTIDPTIDPTKNPTIDPTIDPTRDPTVHPTIDPTTVPTGIPTASPSDAPSNAPTTPPSNAPSRSPSLQPSTAPTVSPSYSPISNPTSAPSSFPSVPPTASPSIAPSLAPSFSPSAGPTNAPTFSPSNAPSYAPSSAPTRIPTTNKEELYDASIEITYIIAKLDDANMDLLEDNSAWMMPDIVERIERGYFVEYETPYTDFMVRVNNVNGFDVENINLKYGGNVTMESIILCKSQIAGALVRKTQNDQFEEEVAGYLMEYFADIPNATPIINANANEDPGLDFIVLNKDEVVESYAEEEEEQPESYEAVVVSACIIAIGLAVSIVVKYQNKKSDAKVDNAKWQAPVLLSFQIYDFISDINLCFDILTNPDAYSDESRVNLILLCGICAVIFTVLPYFVNLLYGITIKSQKVIKDNVRADAYFSNNIAILLAFIVFSGGCHPALMMVSSRMFDLNIFNSGLSNSDLNQLLQIKLKSTICFENVPQLIVQIVYSAQTGVITNATFLAFIGSVLSIILSTASYYAQSLNRKDGDVVSYYIRFAKVNKGDLTPKQKDNIKAKKGRKERLEKEITTKLGIPHESLEIGYVTVESDGIKLHISHYVSRQALEGYTDGRNEQNPNRYGRMTFNATQYIGDMYDKEHLDELAVVFRNHFAEEVDSNREENVTFTEEFDVTFTMNPEENASSSRAKLLAKSGRDQYHLEAARVQLLHTSNDGTTDRSPFVEMQPMAGRSVIDIQKQMTAIAHHLGIHETDFKQSNNGEGAEEKDNREDVKLELEKTNDVRAMSGNDVIAMVNETINAKADETNAKVDEMKRQQDETNAKVDEIMKILLSKEYRG